MPSMLRQIKNLLKEAEKQPSLHAQNAVYEQAVDLCDKALENPDSHATSYIISILYHKASILPDLYRFQEMLTVHQQMAKLDNNNQLTELIRLRIELLNLESKISIFLQQNPRKLNSLEHHQLAMKKLMHAQLYLNTDPDNISILHTKACIEIDLQEFESAQLTIEKILKLNKNHAPSIVNQANIAYKNKQYNKCYKLTQKALRMQFFLANHERDAAFNLNIMCIKQTENKIPAISIKEFLDNHLLKINENLANKEYATTLKEIELVLKHEFAGPEHIFYAYYLQGQTYIAQEQLDLAQVSREKLLVLDPLSPKAKIIQAIIYRKQGKLTEALETYNSIPDAHIEYSKRLQYDVYFWKAICLDNLYANLHDHSKLTEALRLYNKAIKISDADPAVFLFRAGIKLSLGMPKNCLNDLDRYEQALGSPQNNVTKFVSTKAAAITKTGDIKAAIEYLNVVKNTPDVTLPTFSAALDNILTLLSKNDKPKEAISLLNVILDNIEKFETLNDKALLAQIYCHRAELHLMNDAPLTANTDIQEAMKLTPEHPRIKDVHNRIIKALEKITVEISLNADFDPRGRNILEFKSQKNSASPIASTNPVMWILKSICDTALEFPGYAKSAFQFLYKIGSGEYLNEAKDPDAGVKIDKTYSGALSRSSNTLFSTSLDNLGVLANSLNSTTNFSVPKLT